MPETYTAPTEPRLASLDPPEAPLRTLPQVMKRLSFNPKEIRALRRAPAYETLPRWLIPSSNRKYMPPLMHYGWSVDHDRLLGLAMKFDLLRIVEIVDYEGDPDDPADDIKEIITKEVDEVLSVDDLLKALGEQLSPSPPKGLEQRRAINAPHYAVISIYTNYNLRDASELVPDRFVRRLGGVLGEKDPPRWYLDYELCHWCLR